ncbi:MAG: hypothetical protein GXP53_09575, partial [Deltaproteobacteria bacterium]|nr:hypothetical protein [Deltaproteobacteria bacterium]
AIVKKNAEVTPHIWQYFPYPENERWKLIHLFMNNAICGIPHTGAFIKRDVFERHGHFDQNLHNFGDVDYIIRRAETINFQQLPGLRHYYKRNHENQICRHYSYRNQTLVNLMRYCLTHYPLSYYLSDYNKNSSIAHRRQFMCDRMRTLLKTAPPPHTPFAEAMKDYLPPHRHKEQHIFKPVKSRAS